MNAIQDFFFHIRYCCSQTQSIDTTIAFSPNASKMDRTDGRRLYGRVDDKKYSIFKKIGFEEVYGGIEKTTEQFHVEPCLSRLVSRSWY